MLHLFNISLLIYENAASSWPIFLMFLFSSFHCSAFSFFKRLKSASVSFSNLSSATALATTKYKTRAKNMHMMYEANDVKSPYSSNNSCKI